MSEAIGQFKDRQDELTLRRPSLFHAGLQGEIFDLCGIRGRGREIVHSCCCVRSATPSVPGSVSIPYSRSLHFRIKTWPQFPQLS